MTDSDSAKPSNGHLETVRQSIADNAAFSVPYVVMNSLATVVACYGLLQDSTAVVIGAMIIAMLLGPISGIALALVDGDTVLLRKATFAEIGGAAIVFVIAFAIGKIHIEMPLTREALARTAPNLLDLLIALAGGAAGAYATVSPRLSVGLVGVAIATALVPPLSTSAICLARNQTSLAFGAFLLFFANLVAIQFASSVVMFIHGFHRITSRVGGRRIIAVRNAISLTVLLVLAFYLGVNLSKSIAKEQFQAVTRDRLEQALLAYPGVYLAELRFYQNAQTEIVTAVLRTPYSFSPERVAALEATLKAPTGTKIELHIRSVITKETTRNGYLHEAPTPPPSDVPQDPVTTGEGAL